LRFPPDSYFDRAFSYFRNKYENVQFVVASDNPNWCSEQSFFQSADVHIVTGSFAPVVDMAVLAACDHNIITVGTFGWWTAFLGADAKGGEVVYFDSEFVMDHPLNKGNVVVADFYPSGWVPMGGGGEET
jgi:galactoside 2-L-fucosyltransferase 1/2